MSDVMQSLDTLDGQDVDSDGVSEAVRAQDELREQSGDWSGEREVRRWRSKRSS